MNARALRALLLACAAGLVLWAVLITIVLAVFAATHQSLAIPDL